MTDTSHYAETRFGFEYGAATVERLISVKEGVVIGVKTPRQDIQVYVTRTGLIRVFTPGVGKWTPPAKGKP